MSNDGDMSARLRWARLRFSIIGPLLAAPPERGELHSQVEAMAARSYRHPTTGEEARFNAEDIVMRS
jgi:hypothetical protein